MRLYEYMTMALALYVRAREYELSTGVFAVTMLFWTDRRIWTLPTTDTWNKRNEYGELNRETQHR